MHIFIACVKKGLNLWLEINIKPKKFHSFSEETKSHFLYKKTMFKLAIQRMRIFM